MKTRDGLVEIFNSAVEAADPYRAFHDHVRVEDGRLLAGDCSFDLDRFARVVVVGGGKGTAPMARAASEVLGARLSAGLVVVKYGHSEGEIPGIEQVEAAHPLPDEAGVRGAERIKEMLRASDDRTLVVCLLSGGASALLTSPAEGITLDEKREATRMVMEAGADIFELNAVRKHLSSLKGGRLAELASPAALLTVIVSDVMGDRLDTIASGPSVPDATTYGDALAVVEKYGLREKLPASVVERLERGERGELSETPKGGEPFFEKTCNVVIAGLAKSLEAARKRAGELGYEAKILTDTLSGEAAGAARFLAGRALEAAREEREGAPPLCLISGGESTVSVRGGGKGGRSQELALAFALEVEGRPGITLLSAGTDGTDGPTDAAGAVVDGRTAGVARDHGLAPEKYLAGNDSYTFFTELDTRAGASFHLKTGPTGTNVMDVQAIVIEPA